MPSRVRATQGLTIAELLAVLAIAAVIVGMAAPGMAKLVTRSHADAVSEQMVGAVRFARHLAISRGTPARLCPGQGPACGARNNWHEGAVVSAAGVVALQLPPFAAGYKATWNRSGNALTLRADGSISQPGSLFVCPPDGDSRDARRLVVNGQGRIYLERDRDGDGVFDGPDRRAVDC